MSVLDIFRIYFRVKFEPLLEEIQRTNGVRKEGKERKVGTCFPCFTHFWLVSKGGEDHLVCVPFSPRIINGNIASFENTGDGLFPYAGSASFRFYRNS